MKTLVAAACIAVLAALSCARADTVDDQLRQIEPMARDFCRSSRKWSGNEEECIKAQLVAATTMAIYKAENDKVTNAVLQSCFIEAASENPGQIDFTTALSCIQR